LIDVDLGGITKLDLPLLVVETKLDNKRTPDRSAGVSTGKKAEALQLRILIKSLALR
jgi:hypothetical protein